MAALIHGVVAAAPGDLLFTLTAPEPQQGAFFGDMVRSVDGDILISETSRRYLPINVTGRAYLYDGQTGQLKWTFQNPEPTNLDDFARAIAGGDGRVFLSTDGVENRVYAFSMKTGEWIHTIANPDDQGALFGSALAYANGSLLVSAPSYSVPFGPQNVGRAHLFDGASGQLQLPLPNPEPKAGDAFSGGNSVAIMGNSAIVGAAFDDLPSDMRPDGDNLGRVWVFDRITGETLVTLENPNADNQLPPNSFSDRFGREVAAGGGLIVVGAREDGTSGVVRSGTVYVFSAQTGQLKHTLFSPPLESATDFGSALAVTPEGDVLVGEWGASVNGIMNAGRAYLYDGETGNLLMDIPNPEPTAGAGFGWSVEALDGRMVVGTPSGNADGLAGTGAVYVFEGIPEPGTVALGVIGAVFAMILY